jgi:hypothetical protein
MSDFAIEWIDAGKEPSCEPDPLYPDGIELDLSGGALVVCIVDLPHPAKRIGFWNMTCNRCGLRAACTTAGRVDDPKSVTLACKI